MRKLKLDVDELRVESFEADRGRRNAGTVRGNMVDYPADDLTGDGGSGGNSGYQSCPCTQKYTCPAGCSDFCTVFDCPTYATGCCWP